MRGRASRSLLAAGAILAATTACATRGSLLHDTDAWARALRHRGVDPAQVSNPIGVTPEIADAARELGGPGTPLEILRELQRSLFFGSRVAFDYESSATLTAHEALAAGRGNCVAFTNLFIALGRSRGIAVCGALLERQDRAEKKGDLIFVNNHVVAVYPHATGITMYDFYRQRTESVSQIRLLDDLELAALYENNRGVLHLQQGNPGAAVEAFEITVKLWPGFAQAYGNLGVAKRRMGDVDGALEAYRRALRDAPRDPAVLASLASLYTSLGKDREAKTALAAAALRTATPWTMVVRGDLELAEGNPATAARWYRAASRKAPDLIEAFLGLSRAETERGRPRAARRALERADEIRMAAEAKAPAPER